MINNVGNATNTEKRITINDIAKMAEVSVSTVSRVLNNSSEVSKATRRKILKVIEDVNFTPNEMARGLVTKTSKTIGLLIPDILNPFYAELIKGVEDVVSKYGFSLFLCITDQVPEKEEYYINEMLKRRNNGLIIMSTCISNKEVLTKAKKAMEIVSIQADIEDVDSIGVTDEQGTYEIINYLISLGHEKIAFIGYMFGLTPIRNRLLGYKKALGEHGIPIRDEFVIEGDILGNPGYSMAKRLLELDDRPTAVHCMNEYIASGTYLAINESSLKIPDDISLTGFDNLNASRLMTPQLTTVAQPVYSMGEVAAELLIKNILEGSKSIRQSIVLPTKLLVRGSAAAPKG